MVFPVKSLKVGVNGDMLSLYGPITHALLHA